MTKTVYIQNWEESERGWGTRPDGFTIHTSLKQLNEYITWYNKTFNNLSFVPDEYTRICGDPVKVEVSDELFERIEKATEKVLDGRVLNCIHGKGNWFSKQDSLSEDKINWRSD